MYVRGTQKYISTMCPLRAYGVARGNPLAAFFFWDTRFRRLKLHIAYFAALRQKCAHSAASPLKNATTTLGCVFGNIMSPKKRASRGIFPLDIPPIAHDVVVADCAKLAPSKSAALTRSVAPPLKNTNTAFGLCFCNLSLRTCMVAGMSVKLQYRLSSPVESDLRRCVHVVHRCAKRGGLQRGYPPCYVFFGATISFAYVKEMVAYPAALRSRRQNTLLPKGQNKRYGACVDERIEKNVQLL